MQLDARFRQHHLMRGGLLGSGTYWREASSSGVRAHEVHSEFFGASWLQGHDIRRRQLSLQLCDTVIQFKDSGVSFA